jgi:hypothetical protein
LKIRFDSQFWRMNCHLNGPRDIPPNLEQNENSNMTYIEAELAEARMLLEAITSGRLRLRIGGKT